MKALYILSPSAQELIYGPEQRQTLQSLLDIYAPPQTAQSVVENPDIVRDLEIILSGWGGPKLDQRFLDHAPNLKAVFYGAGSIKGLVTAEFWKKQIPITSSWAANAIPVAEYSFACITLSLKRFWHFSKETKRQRTFPERSHWEFPGAFGTNVGIVSLGMIGRLVAERLQQMDVQVYAYDPFISQEDASQLGVNLVDLNTLFSECQVVSMHTPWLPETEKLITGDLLRKMKPNATLINTSRGAVLDETSAIEAFSERTDLTAILDVTHPEPPVSDSPWYDLPNVLITPHMAGSLGKECHRMGAYVVADVQRFLKGEPLRWQISEAQSKIMA